MPDDNPTSRPTLPAGDFSAWIVEIQGALRGEHATDVPCGSCTACCTSSQFIHIGPEEADSLAHIPAALMFPAPRLPSGHVLLGYDKRGRCPMLVDNRCSIYEHRPRTCRTYDCRIFPAAGIELDDDDKALIAEQSRRWRFTYPSQRGRDQHAAVRLAASFLRDHPDLLSDGSVPTHTTPLAVLAVEIHESFLHHDTTTDRTTVAEPSPDVVRVEVTGRTLRPRTR